MMPQKIHGELCVGAAAGQWHFNAVIAGGVLLETQLPLSGQQYTIGALDELKMMVFRCS